MSSRQCGARRAPTHYPATSWRPRPTALLRQSSSTSSCTFGNNISTDLLPTTLQRRAGFNRTILPLCAWPLLQSAEVNRSVAQPARCALSSTLPFLRHSEVCASECRKWLLRSPLTQVSADVNTACFGSALSCFSQEILVVSLYLFNIFH